MSIFSVQNYKTALTKSTKPVFSRDLLNKDLSVVNNDKNEPIKYFGSSSVVFKLAEGDRYYALKCFTTELFGRWDYLQKVQQILSKNENTWIVPFEIYENELELENDLNQTCTCSVLLMPWIEGERLLDKIKLYCSQQNTASIRELTKSFIEFAVNQIGQPFSHGDITPENIIVTPSGKMLLIDHDTFTFKDWENKPGRGGWSFPYHHPNKSRCEPNIDEDQFSFLLLTICLKALEHNPLLFERFNSSKGLLFNIDDFKTPRESAIVREIEKIKDPVLQNLLKLLIIRLHKNSIDIPELKSYLIGSDLRRQEKMLEPEWRILTENENNNKYNNRIHTKPPELFTTLVNQDRESTTESMHEASRPQKTQATNSLYQKQRNRVRRSVFIALLFVVVLVVGIKIFSPENRFLNPVNYKQLMVATKNDRTKPQPSNSDKAVKVTDKKQEDIVKGNKANEAKNEIATSNKSNNLASTFLPQPPSKTVAALIQSKPQYLSRTKPSDQRKKTNIYTERKNFKNTVVFRKTGF